MLSITPSQKHNSIEYIFILPKSKNIHLSSLMLVILLYIILDTRISDRYSVKILDYLLASLTNGHWTLKNFFGGYEYEVDGHYNLFV